MLGASDLDQLKHATDNEEIFVSPDMDFVKERALAHAILNLRGRVPILPREYANSKLWDQAWWLLSRWLMVCVQVRNLPPGTCARVRVSGLLVNVDPNAPVPRRRSRRRAMPFSKPLNGPLARMEL